MDWQQYVLGIVAAAIIIPLIGFIIKIIWDWIKILRETSKVEIDLKVPREILNTGTKFGLLHVRDGKDEVTDKGKLRNKKRWFKEVGEVGQQVTLRASVRYTKKLGFQFKCFADYKGIGFKKLKKALQKRRYSDVGEDVGRRGRAWFIHPAYSSCQTVDRIKNNFFYPE